MFNKVKNISFFILLALLIIFGVILFKKKDNVPYIVKVPVVMEVKVPAIIATFPPREFPIPKKETRKKALEKEFKESTVEQKDSLYADAVTERSYEEIFSDSIQSITVRSNVQGKLLNQTLNYEIFSRTIKIDTTVPVDISKLQTRKVLLGGEVGIPLIPNGNATPVFGVKLMYQNKQSNIYSIGIDTEARINFGYSVQILKGKH